MLVCLILTSLIGFLSCQYEVGVKYNYLFESKSVLTTQEFDGTQRIQPIDFTCISSIKCTSVDEEGFQLELKLSGIKIIQRDSEGVVTDVISSLAMSQAYNRPFVFTMLKSGLIGKVKCPADEDEEIMRIKSAIVAQFISLGEGNEAEESHVETLDNLGIYLSHWKKKRGREEDEVELTREFTDEDFIFFRDARTDQHTYVMRVLETKKLKKGVLTRSDSKNKLFLAGKEYRDAKRNLVRRSANKRKLYNGIPMEDYKYNDNNGNDDDAYNGTSVTASGTATLKLLGSVNLVGRRSNSKNLTSNEAESESRRGEELKPVPYLTRDYYAPRMRRAYPKALRSGMKSNLALGTQMDDLLELVLTEEDKKELDEFKNMLDWAKNEGGSEDFGLGALSRLAGISIDLCEGEDASLTDPKIGDDSCVKKSNVTSQRSKSNSHSNKNENTNVYSQHSDSNLHLNKDTNENANTSTSSNNGSQENSYIRKLLARTTRAPSPSTSHPLSSSFHSLSSSLSSSPFGTHVLTTKELDAGRQQSNGLLSKIECPEGLDRCYQIGGSMTMGNDDFGGYFGAFILAGSETNCFLDCNFQVEAKGSASVNVLGRKFTLLAFNAKIERIDGFSKDNHVIVQVLGTKSMCCWKDIACKPHAIPLKNITVPVLGFNWELDFFVIKVKFNLGISAIFDISLEITVCVPEGYAGVALVPTLGISAGAGASLKIGKCPFCVEGGIGLNATTDVSFIPQGVFDMHRNSLIFSGNVRWRPLRAQMEAYVKVASFKKKTWKLFDWQLKEISKTVFEMAFALPWTNTERALSASSSATSSAGTSAVTRAETQALHALINDAYKDGEADAKADRKMGVFGVENDGVTEG